MTVSAPTRTEGTVQSLTRAGIWVLLVLAALNGLFLYFAPGRADTWVANPATILQTPGMPPPARARPATIPAAATPMAFARALAGAYRRHGRSPDGALKLARITPAQLQKADGRITARQMELLSATAMQELDDEGLGAFGRRLPWGSYGMLARASLTAASLRRARC